MGLDMYLTGEAYYTYQHENRKLPLPIKETHYELGYWRKHPNLHGYIVNEFADGKDECQNIDLSKDDLHRIMKAVTGGNLPDTDGFFFGASAANPERFSEKYGCTIEEALAEKEREQKADLLIIQSAIDWLDADEDNVWKSVIYRASW